MNPTSASSPGAADWSVATVRVLPRLTAGRSHHVVPGRSTAVSGAHGAAVPLHRSAPAGPGLVKKTLHSAFGVGFPLVGGACGGDLDEFMPGRGQGGVGEAVAGGVDPVIQVHDPEPARAGVGPQAQVDCCHARAGPSERSVAGQLARGGEAGGQDHRARGQGGYPCLGGICAPRPAARSARRPARVDHPPATYRAPPASARRRRWRANAAESRPGSWSKVGMKTTPTIASAVFAQTCRSSHARNDSPAGASAGSAAMAPLSSAGHGPSRPRPGRGWHRAAPPRWAV